MKRFKLTAWGLPLMILELRSSLLSLGRVQARLTLLLLTCCLASSGDTCAVKGRVESISGVVDSSTGSVSACAVFPNTDGLLLSGTSGTFYKQFGLTMAVAVGISLLYALTLAPALCAMILKPRKE